MKIKNLNKIKKMVKEKYISVQKHPEADYYIYNYTQKAQFDKVWNEETTMCRGLILDSKGEILQRPFKKFFNLSEHDSDEKPDIPNEPFDVYEKMDGSLGILYFYNGMPFIATRGSFTSEQAIEGTKILRQKYQNVIFNPLYTYLFEIIYPENKIVVNYGKERDLYLLACIATETGEEALDSATTYGWQDFGPRNKFPTPKKYNYTSIEEITKLMSSGTGEDEGFVIKFKGGMRVKIKYDEYVRLHRLITGVNKRRIWDLLRNGSDLNELLTKVPEEFYKWVDTTAKEIKKEYQTWESSSVKIWEQASKLKTRKEQAEMIKQFNCRSIVFNMLDGKDHSKIIWQMIKPKAEKPFVDVSDDI